MVALDLGVATAARSFAEGDARLLLFTLGAGAEATWTFAPISIGLGPSVELGWGIANGAGPSSGVAAHSGGGVVVTAGLSLRFGWAFTDGLGLTVRAVGGYTARGLEATVDGVTRAGWYGPYGGAIAGFWFDL